MDVKGKLEGAREFISDVDESRDPFDLIIARDEGGEDTADYDFGRAKTVGNLPNRLGDLVEKQLNHKIESIADGKSEAVEYAAANIHSANDYVQHVSPEEVPRFDDFEELLTTDDFPSRNYLSNNSRPPEFQVIMVRDGTGNRLLAFQRVTRRYILGRDDRIRFWSSDDHYTPVEQTIVEVPNRIDVIYYQDALLIFKQTNFEKIFDYMAEFNEAAEETIDSIVASKVPIHTDDVFLEAVKAYPHAPRLFYAVKERALWEHENVDMDTFEYIIDEYNLKISVEERSGERGIVMNDKRHVWEVIHLYNDDHLDSPITEVGYQVSGKDARTS